MINVANRNQPGETGRRTSRPAIPPTGATVVSWADGADEPPIRVTISVSHEALVLCQYIRTSPAPGRLRGRARHRKLPAESWPALLRAVFGDGGWTLRAAFIAGELLCATLGALTLASHFVTAGTGVFGTGAVVLVLTAIVGPRTAKSPAAKE